MLEININKPHAIPFEDIPVNTFFVGEFPSQPNLYFKLDDANAYNVTQQYTIKFNRGSKFFVVRLNKIEAECV